MSAELLSRAKPTERTVESKPAQRTVEPTAAVAILTADQLQTLVRDAVEQALVALQMRPQSTPTRCTIPEAAKQLGCCDRQVHRLRKIGALEFINIGKRVLIMQASIDALLAEALR